MQTSIFLRCFPLLDVYTSTSARKLCYICFFVCAMKISYELLKPPNFRTMIFLTRKNRFFLFCEIFIFSGWPNNFFANSYYQDLSSYLENDSSKILELTKIVPQLKNGEILRSSKKNRWKNLTFEPSYLWKTYIFVLLIQYIFL